MQSRRSLPCVMKAATCIFEWTLRHINTFIFIPGGGRDTVRQGQFFCDCMSLYRHTIQSSCIHTCYFLLWNIPELHSWRFQSVSSINWAIFITLPGWATVLYNISKLSSFNFKILVLTSLLQCLTLFSQPTHLPTLKRNYKFIEGLDSPARRATSLILLHPFYHREVWE